MHGDGETNNGRVAPREAAQLFFHLLLRFWTSHGSIVGKMLARIQLVFVLALETTSLHLASTKAGVECGENGTT